MINREDFEEMKQWSSEQTGWLDQSEMKGFFSLYEDDHKIENKESCGECYYAVNSCSLCEYHTRANADGDIFEFDIPSKEYYCGSFKRKDNE